MDKKETDGGILLYVKDLSIRFLDETEDKNAVCHADFYIKKGETAAIIGESGAGKTTLMRVCMGLSGKKAEVEGQALLNCGKEGFLDICSMTRKDRIRKIFGKKIAMVFQDPSVCLDPVMTIGSQLLESLCLKKRTGRMEGMKEAVRLLKRIGMEDGERILKLYPHQLSGGMRQRIAMLLALIPEPQLLICDEPSSALDPLAKEQLFSMIGEERKRRSMAVVYITHDIGLARTKAEHVYVMRQGRIVEQGRAEEVFSRPQDPYTKTLLKAAEKVGCREEQDGKEDKERTGRPLLEVKGLCRTYRSASGQEIKAADGVNFAVYPGEIYGLIGGSGEGKTTVARMIMGICQPDQGEIRLEGKTYSGKISRTDRQEFYRKVQMVFQDPAACLNPSRRVVDIVAQALDIQKEKIEKEERLKRVGRMLHAVGLSEEIMYRFPGQLSGGQRQRVGIARTMISEPKLVIVDEGVSALDPLIQIQIADLLKSIQEKTGVAILFISHDLPVVRRICARVGVMHQGRIVEEGWTEDVFAHPSSRYAKELLAAGGAEMQLAGRRVEI